jgi:hypothetical protein
LIKYEYISKPIITPSYNLAFFRSLPLRVYDPVGGCTGAGLESGVKSKYFERSQIT